MAWLVGQARDSSTASQPSQPSCIPRSSPRPTRGTPSSVTHLDSDPCRLTFEAMLSPASVAFLKRLLDTPGPSGFEGGPARVWRDHAHTFADVRGDVAGNSLATVNGGGAPVIMLAGHIDEIGLIVTYIDDDGYLYVSGIGGWDPQVLVGQRVRILARGDDVIGVIGK